MSPQTISSRFSTDVSCCFLPKSQLGNTLLSLEQSTTVNSRTTLNWANEIYDPTHGRISAMAVSFVDARYRHGIPLGFTRPSPTYSAFGFIRSLPYASGASTSAQSYSFRNM